MGALSSGVLVQLSELRTDTDVMAIFTTARHQQRSYVALDGRLEHLRGSVLGFRNLTNYTAASMHERGGFTQQLHPRLR